MSGGIDDHPAGAMEQLAGASAPSRTVLARSVLFWTLLGAGILLRVLVVALAGNELASPWSGGSDVRQYVMLAENLHEGRGFSYAGQPSAYRPPGYPVLLAGMMELFGNRYATAVRWLQFLLGLATAALCGRLAARLFGPPARRPALLIALFLPTLAFVTSELLTECLAAFLIALFVYLLVGELIRPRPVRASALGLLAGVASLLRFNMPPLLAVGLCTTVRLRPFGLDLRRAGVMLAAFGIALLPWVVRNLVRFDGQVIYSTSIAYGAIHGALAPQGRTQAGEMEDVVGALGWFHTDLETNSRRRARLPDEAHLRSQAQSVARRVWLQLGPDVIPLIAAKLSYFWLSTEQILHTSSFSDRQRRARTAGVLVHWVVLGLALIGWFSLRRLRAPLATGLALYALIITLAHIPFGMNTRYRVPLIDPVLVVLASGGLLQLTVWLRQRRATAPASAASDVMLVRVQGRPQHGSC